MYLNKIERFIKNLNKTNLLPVDKFQMEILKIINNSCYKFYRTSCYNFKNYNN